MIFYHQSKEEVLNHFNTSEAEGLSSDKVEELRNKFGENRLQEKKKKGTLARFLDQFKDLMILILIGAAVISFVVACIEKNPKEFFEPALILLIVVLNAVMGVAQESKA